MRSWQEIASHKEHGVQLMAATWIAIAKQCECPFSRTVYNLGLFVCAFESVVIPGDYMDTAMHFSWQDFSSLPFLPS